MSKTAVEREYQRYHTDIINPGLIDRTTITIREAQIPIIKAVDYTPQNMIPFNEANASLKKDVPLKGMVHMFLSDDHLERLWSKPEYYAKRLKNFEAVASPDFSVYENWLHPMNIYNVYRNRLIGQYFQEQGLTVVPTVTWSGKETYAYAFMGLEPNGTYVISANGCFHNNRYLRDLNLSVYQNGVEHLVKTLSPKRILVHGSCHLPDANYGDAEVIFFQSKMSVEKNMRQHPHLFDFGNADITKEKEEIKESARQSA